jgi:hypothetical protein
VVSGSGTSPLAKRASWAFLAGLTASMPHINAMVPFMTDLQIQALGLLQFIEESLQEGIQRPDTLVECLSEADQTLRILKKIVRHDDMLCASFAATAASDLRFSDIGGCRTERERGDALNRCL